MSHRFRVDHGKVRDLLESVPDHPLGGYHGLKFPAEGPLVPLAERVVEDFERTSGFTSGFEVSPRTPKRGGERIIGNFGLAVDLTPFLVAIITWILKTVLDQIVDRRKTLKLEKESPARLSEEELQGVKELVVSFGKSINDKEILTPAVTEKFADSIDRILRQHPEVLLRIKSDSSVRK